MRKSVLLVAVGVVGAVCAQSSSQGLEQSVDKPVLVGTIHELMEDIVEPSADVLWNATAIISDEKGVHNMAPKTDEEWEVVRRAALALTEAPNLVTMEGRKLVPDGETIGTGGTLDAAGIQARLIERRASFLKHAATLQTVAWKALRAVDAKDLKRLDAVGGDIDEACEACHKEFWYPDDGPIKNP